MEKINISQEINQDYTEAADIDSVDWSLAERAKSPEGHHMEWLEHELNSRIVGQPQAVEAIVEALLVEEYRDKRKPISSMMFLGPTGVGKTETANELAAILHGYDGYSDEGGGVVESKPVPFLRIDCSEYSQDFSISRLIGSTPGYIGYGGASQLDKKTIEQHRSVILFDEIEKGSSKLHDLLLQILSDGKITMGDAEEISFRDSIIIMTSNVGADDIMRLTGRAGTTGFTSSRQDRQIDIEKSATNAMHDLFRPEMIGRIDKKVVFNTLEDDQYAEVLDRYINTLNYDYYDRAGVTVSLSDELKSYVVEGAGDRIQLGARPVLNNFNSEVSGRLARYLSDGSIPYNSYVMADVFEGDDGSHEVGFLHMPDPNYIAEQEVEEEVKRRLSSSKEVCIYTKPSDVLERMGSTAIRGGVDDSFSRIVQGNQRLIDLFKPKDDDPKDRL